MIVQPFINLYRTQKEAFYFRNSIINTQYIFNGIHLRPNNPTKYIQATQTPSGIDLEDWQVNIVDFQTREKTDVTDYFFVDALTNDDNGNPQLFWSLTNVPFDFGWRFVYLEVNQLVGESFYSNPFMLTEINAERTSIFHYKTIDDTVFQCIGLETFFIDEDKKTELTTYYETSTRNTVTKSVKTMLIDTFRTELMPKSTLIKLTDVLESPILFINNQRYSLYEAVDIPKKISEENFAMVEYMVSPTRGVSFFDTADYSDIDYGTDYNI